MGGSLIYATIASLDGYVADESGSFEWAAPDAQVHAFINDLERGIDVYLYPRIWQTAEKIVYRGRSRPRAPGERGSSEASTRRPCVA
jgi:hypothetical protein